MEYSSFSRRFAAYLIDHILSLILCLIAIAVLYYFVYWTTRKEPDKSIITIVFLLIPWLYWAVMESSTKQSTLGKMTLGIIVTDLEGNRITFGKATVRYWAKLISAAILFIGFIMAASTEKKQALHDIIAGTVVRLRR